MQRIAIASIIVAVGSLAQPTAAQMTSTNCMISGNMVNCTSIGDSYSASQGDGGRALGEGIGSLVASIGEKNFRKKIGRMLADGDCRGASRYAYEKGRLELGSSIADACGKAPSLAPVAATRSSTPQSQIAPADLEGTLAQVAKNAKTPMEVFEKTTVSKVEANGGELIMTALVNQKGANITEAGRLRMMREICGSAEPLLKAGATIRVEFYEQSKPKKAPFDTIIATQRDCTI